MNIRKLFANRWCTTGMLLILVLTFAGACVPVVTPAPGGSGAAPTKAPSALTLSDLQNAEYQGVYAKPVQLTDGKYEGEPFVEGGASRPTVIMTPVHAFGDLNGDGVEDAVVVLVESSGGSGNFRYLAGVINREGKPENVATVSLGDRVQVQTISIDAGEIALNTATHGPDDPLCCPSQETTHVYELRGDQLVKVSEEMATLENTVWTLVSFGDADSPQTVLKDSEITAVFDAAEGRVSGSAGCNQYFGSFEVDGSKLSVSPLASTMMMCPEESVMDQEQDYLTILQAAESYQIEGDQLRITAGDDEVLVFKAQGSAGLESAASDKLEDTNWILSGIRTGDSVNTTEIDQEITAVFLDGQLTGFAGCNNYFTSYETDGKSLALGSIGSTRKACDDARNLRETEFLKALEAVTGYHVVDDMLELVDADGDVRIRLQPQAEAAVPNKLRGTWQWLAFQDSASGAESNDITVSDPSKYTLEFLADGTAQIKADCNNASSSYTVDGSSLTFAPGPMTLAECDPSSLYGEYVNKLGDVVSYVIDEDGNLVLNLKMDASNMVFAAEATPAP